DGSICLDNEEWDRRFPFSHQALRRRLQTGRAAKSEAVVRLLLNKGADVNAQGGDYGNAL
ncbi:hypothetical protein N658DRAFT_455066, partial [Parathielavia hyrcaniae]